MKVARTISRFSRAFWLAWLVRGVLPAVYKKLRNRHKLITLIDGRSVSSAAVLAAFFTLFRCGESALKSAAWSAAIASSVFVLEGEETRRPWAQFLCLRVLLAVAKSKLSKSHLQTATIVAFTAAIAELMYGVVVRPDVGEGLSKWLGMTGAMPTGEAMAECRVRIGKGRFDTCQCLHGKQGCVERILSVYYNVFKSILPVNLLLSSISSLRSGRLQIGDALQSSVFSASCVTAYQVILCLHGKLVRSNRDPLPRHRYIYALFGAVAGLCVFLEKADRRPEVALFAMTRAVDVGWGLLRKRGVVRGVAGGDLVLLSASVSAIMHLHRTSPHLLSPLSNAAIRLMCPV